MVSMVPFWTFGEVVLWAGKGSKAALSGHDWSCWLDDRGESPGDGGRKKRVIRKQ